ncbi:unnamed protein product [Blepharisma stoltei]|uniref:C2 domain-containing protein n=1 Tax=Blepharisma stoltei TaxID=1481888 RepID=A0AAU9IYA7_9CILI|nr:unnamed protein product [Blepharisma stoltei]
MVSTYTTSDSCSEIGFSRFPYVSIKICEARNLQAYSEYSQELKPYIKISKGSHKSQTKSATTSDDVIWNENFEVSGDGFDSLIICLMDHDEFDGDIVLAGLSFPMELLKQWREEKVLWVRLIDPKTVQDLAEEDNILTFTEDMEIYNPADTQCPILKLEISYFGIESLREISSKIVNSEIIERDGKTYTEYEMVLTRKDGFNWKVNFRYSQLRKVRKNMIKRFPELKELKFPGKTALSFLHLKRSNKFSEERIEQRKQVMEKFLNYTLKCQYQQKCSDFYQFLQVPYN